MARGIAIKVFGDYACFSRPEFKVERVSYQMITPSAARGVLEAVFWKPEIRYQIRTIEVVKMGAQTSILRNEVSDRQRVGPPVVAQSIRQQRTSLVLKNVAYVIHGEIALREHAKDEIGKYLDQFNRRVEKGQCYQRPYLGTREFAAFFEQPGPLDRGLPDLNMDLGQMLFDIAYVEGSGGTGELEFLRPGVGGARKVRGHTASLFFHARIERGVLHIPGEKYQELCSLEAKGA
jgi:CRISPR-associated protein Cas5d